MSINKVILIGHLGQDPELKYTPSGAAVCNFSIATTDRWADKSGQKQEKTEWHKIVVWGKLAELCNQYLAKGRQAFIEGSLQTRSWEDQNNQKKYTTEIIARNVQFLSSGQGVSTTSAGFDQSAPAQAPRPNNQTNNYEAVSDSNFTSDDIPF